MGKKKTASASKYMFLLALQLQDEKNCVWNMTVSKNNLRTVGLID
jgi:hypothetical protein